MRDLNVASVMFFVCVGLFTIASAVWDFRFRRIPNKLTLPMFILGLVFQTVVGGWSGSGVGLIDGGLKSALLGFAIGFGTLFALWLIGGGGGGDVKLMGALAVWLGHPLTLLVLICSTVFVLAGTLSSMAWGVVIRGRTAMQTRLAGDNSGARRRSNLGAAGIEEKQKRRMMAFAVPVALATWVVLLWKLPQL